MENIEMISTSLIYPHPDNPRKDLGDLTELAESIRQNGVYQNLTVVLRTQPIKTSEDAHMAEADMQEEENEHIQKIKMRLLDKGYRAAGGYTVVIGHRRLAAAKLAGLEKVPCVVADMMPRQQVETMLLENMQRADLTIMEQAHGFQLLLDFGDSVKEIAEKTGFSERTVRRRTEIARLDPAVLKDVMKNRGKQLTLEDFDMLAKIDDIDERNRLLKDIGTNGFKYMLEEARSKQENKKSLPEVTAWLKERNAKEITNNQFVWRDYVRTDNFGWSGCPLRDFEKKKEKLEDVGKEQLYYIITDTGNLSLYHKKPDAPEEKEKKPEKSPEEIEKQKKIDAAWDYLEQQAKIMHDLRKDFIKKIKVTTKNRQDVLKGVLLWLVVDDAGVDFDGALQEALGLKDGWDKGMSDLGKMKYVDELDGNRLARVVYSLFEDEAGEEGAPISNTWQRNKEFPEYDESTALPALYFWLGKLGYETSDIERGIIDGTDEHFHMGDTEAENEG